jgi:hypothetical protein
MFQLIQAIEMTSPGLAVAILGQLANHPTEAVGLDTHQNRLLPDEDFVKGPFPDARPGDLVQDFENGGGLLLSLLREAAERTY